MLNTTRQRTTYFHDIDPFELHISMCVRNVYPNILGRVDFLLVAYERGMLLCDCRLHCLQLQLCLLGARCFSRAHVFYQNLSLLFIDVHVPLLIVFKTHDNIRNEFLLWYARPRSKPKICLNGKQNQVRWHINMIHPILCLCFRARILCRAWSSDLSFDLPTIEILGFFESNSHSAASSFCFSAFAGYWISKYTKGIYSECRVSALIRWMNLSSGSAAMGCFSNTTADEAKNTYYV